MYAGIQNVRQTLEVLISQRLNVPHCQATTGKVQRRVSVTMPISQETFCDLFSCLPSAPSDLRCRRHSAKFSVPPAELDLILDSGWSLNTFKTSTVCRVLLDKPVDVSFFTKKKVFFDHSHCPHCNSATSMQTCQPKKRIKCTTTMMKLSFYCERQKKTIVQRQKPTLSWAKDRKEKWRDTDKTHKTTAPLGANTLNKSMSLMLKEVVFAFVVLVSLVCIVLRFLYKHLCIPVLLMYLIRAKD